jgi:hypothetical protein
MHPYARAVMHAKAVIFALGKIRPAKLFGGITYILQKHVLGYIFVIFFYRVFHKVIRLELKIKTEAQPLSHQGTKQKQKQKQCRAKALRTQSESKSKSKAFQGKSEAKAKVAKPS